ncbi:AAA family ATPase [Schlesneria paludicola]|uniref:AAA family ATPase n=1 Tax=Schlesneria paludicola TaxID=360056 RepID=UPI000299F880|nr:MoxR family ATPase [Schlesneria paludicola]
MHVDIQRIKEQVLQHSDKLEQVRAEVRKVLVGQDVMLSRLLIAMLTGGHVLLEGLPGLAKTTAIKALASALRCQFNRIQFTPDLLPADLIGTMIYNPREGSFGTRKGPIFANLILADEINRAPSKVQSALLEAMQEHQVTIGDQSYRLEEPFLVLATQNPIEQEGTYPLPEAQVDRFMLKIIVDYPTKAEERKVVDAVLDDIRREVQPVLDPAHLADIKRVVGTLYMDDKVKDYVLDVVAATRRPEDFKLSALKPLIEFGASPRASINLCLAARANAFLAGRGYVTPQDVKDIALDVLRHRVILTYEAEAESMTSDDVVRKVLESVPVP